MIALKKADDDNDDEDRNKYKSVVANRNSQFIIIAFLSQILSNSWNHMKV